MNLFTDHPNDHGLTYFQHMKFALWGGFKMISAGSACLLHAFLPFLFKWQATDTIYKIIEEVEKKDAELLNNMHPEGL